jgi:lipoyl(octanoyl) transferase
LEPGESPAEAAAREVREETGQSLAVIPLGYRHCFAWGDELPPRVVEETAFAAFAPAGSEVRVDPREHDSFSWESVNAAVDALPFRGLRAAVRLAAEVHSRGTRLPQ